MEKLRDEILQAQQIRSDLLKWKLVLVGPLGAVGLGLAGAPNTADADLVLCAVPLVCLYVDLLTLHLSLRILVIGAFVRGAGETTDMPQVTAYEVFAQNARELSTESSSDPRVWGSAFDLEDWAGWWSTVVLSGLVFGYGLLRAFQDSPIGLAFIGSGVIGMVVSRHAKRSYDKRCKAVGKLAPSRPPASGSGISGASNA
jgi:hypothetical protein